MLPDSLVHLAQMWLLRPVNSFLLPLKPSLGCKFSLVFFVSNGERVKKNQKAEQWKHSCVTQRANLTEPRFSVS